MINPPTHPPNTSVRGACRIMLRSGEGAQSKKFRRAAAIAISYATHTHRRTGRRGFPPCLQAGPRGYRVEAQGLALSLWPLPLLAQDEGRRCSSSEARRGGRMEEQAEMTTFRTHFAAAMPVIAIVSWRIELLRISLSAILTKAQTLDLRVRPRIETAE